MKNYSFFFRDESYDIDIVPNSGESRFYELFEDENSLYILVPFQGESEDLLKIFYPKSDYLAQVRRMRSAIAWQFVLLSLIAVFISLLFSFYVLSPLRNALILLETFIKDIIHDLNTPVTSILINLKMLGEKNDETESIEKSAKTIAMLHQNLDAYLKEQPYRKERFDLKETILEQIAFFEPLYDYIEWRVSIPSYIVVTDKSALTRLVYNLLSNACKYNTTDGFIEVSLSDDTLSITNSSHGIDRPDRIFERFYKENERGLGIGLHIVKKLSEALQTPVTLQMQETTVTFSVDLRKVTLN